MIFEPTNETHMNLKIVLLFSLVILCSNNIFASCLSGNYTIGGNSPDFITFADAITGLKTNGVCGKVIFKVRDGSYNEYVRITSIKGTSTTNTITFQSENGDSSKVIVYNLSNYPNTCVVSLDSATNITFSKMTFKQASSGGNVITLLDNPKNINFLNCQMVGAHGDLLHVVYALNSGDSNCTFKNNLLLNGGYSFYMDGTSGIQSYSCTIDGNTMEKMADGGIFFTYGNNPVIAGNTISSDTINGSYGVLAEFNSGLVIAKNKINIFSNDGGIYMADNYGTSASPVSCSNNFVIGPSGYGIFSSFNGYVDIYNNNVNIYQYSYLTYALFLTPDGGKTRLANNNLINSGGGYSMSLDDNSYISYSGHNNFYSSGKNPFSYINTDYADLKSFTAKSGLDSSSISEDPKYTSSSNLHVGDSNLIGKGIPIAGLTTDIDGDKRNPKATTIGADEIPTAGGTSVFRANSVCLGNATSFTDSSLFIGIDSIINWKWIFGDGTTSSKHNPSHTYAKGGSYNSELVITNKSGLIDSTFRTVTVDSTCKWILKGIINASAGAALKSSKVYLCTYDVKEVDSVLTDSSGNYSFSTTDSTVYLFAMPSLNTFPHELPTWADSGLAFQDGTAITLRPGTTIKNFKTIYGSNPGGSGFIGGKVVYCPLCKVSAPVVKLRIILADSNGKAQAYTYTDSNGNFSFKNIAISKYKILVDRPHVDNGIAPLVDITSHSSSNLSFTLYPTYLDLNTNSGIERQFKDISISIYPNPAHDKLYIQLKSDDPASLKYTNNLLTLTDISGKVLSSKTINTQESFFDLSSITSGIYLLRFQNKEGVQFLKFSKY